MASFIHLEMAQPLSADTRITIKKSFFGKKAIYNATQSRINFSKTEYNTEEGLRLEHLLRLPAERLESELEGMQKFHDAGIGTHLLEKGISADHQLAALRLYRYDQLHYIPITDLIILEGEKAQRFASLL
ncbi:MAG: hypothetical protein K6A82_07530 [Prevotella sp.]|nr:hypothetical protein [Prevotella sp.]